MKKFRGVLGLILLSSHFLNAQVDEELDSLETVKLQDVVVTGQYSAQSVNKSLYQVEIISADDIKNQAGNTIADVLNQNLNLKIDQNPGSGDSTINLMGFSGDYVKVLIDNIPLVADTGFGNNIDLTKINLDNVERIEIVKGAMGVDYGSNALAGIINIITKKSAKTDWKINFMVQEETVGNEYDWYEDGGVTKGKGRHIQALNITKRLGTDWVINAGFNRNDFQGFWGSLKGKKHFEQDFKRGYEWLPKEQWNSFASINYRTKNFSAFYKVTNLTEEINFYNDVIIPVETNGERTFKANDKDYFTNRWVHHLNLQTKLFDRVQYDGDFSFQTQERKSQTYQYDIPARAEIARDEKKEFLSTKVYYSRGTFSKFLDRKFFDFQVGYEFEFNKGFANEFADSFEFSDNVDKEIGTYAGFASAEFHTNFGFSVRPGFRVSFSNKFENQYNYSVSMKYNLTDHSNIRAVIGTANRYPSFSELYSYQVDVNHSILGDENLVPEDGYSTSIQWNNRNKWDNFRMENNISTMYLHLENKIELIQLDPLRPDYLFKNIDKAVTWGITTEHRFWYDNWNLNVGASLFGDSRAIHSNNFKAGKADLNSENNDKFLYNFQVNAALNYSIPSWATTLSVYYKYTGKSSQYVIDLQNSTSNYTAYKLAKRDDYNMLNAAIRKGFYNNRFEVTLGARNILDVTSITDESLVGEGHTGSAGSDVQLFYGRSYFLKLVYNLEF